MSRPLGIYPSNSGRLACKSVATPPSEEGIPRILSQGMLKAPWGIWGLGFRVSGSGFRLQGLDLGVGGLGFRIRLRV